jgi:hypothetical protein
MAILRLGPHQIKEFDARSEVAMDVQIGLDESETPYVVVGSRVAIQHDDKIQDELAKFTRARSEKSEQLKARMDVWLLGLPTIATLRPAPTQQAYSILAFMPLGPRYPLPKAPPRRSYVHGHLPFHGICSGEDVFYRYEAFSTSLRVDLKTNSVTKPNTYGAPFSEGDFTPTGLSAVGRFALPSLLPACWRYTLTPPKGTEFYYGASVPLYGQSGGAVEVMFPKPFSNNGPIAVTVLPVL